MPKIKLTKTLRVKLTARNTIQLVVHDERTDSWTVYSLDLSTDTLEEVSDKAEENVNVTETSEEVPDND